MPRVLISAAHTLENPGEVFGDLREADLTRKILKKTIPYLEAHKIEFQAVPLDLQLLKRIDWIAQTGYSREQGDIFVEIHVNDGGKRGVEGWFEGKGSTDNNSQKLAETIVNNICKQTGYANNGIRSEFEHELGSLIILDQINPIGTLVECLYIDNPEDIVILKDETKLDDLAKAIADAINDYIKNVAPTLKYAEKARPKGMPFPGGFSSPIAKNVAPLNPPVSPFMQSSQASGAGFSSAASPFNPAAAQKPVLMDREERKEMIKKIYQKVLNKEPSQNDLNYHLNTGVTEAELIKKLVEGPDHEKILQDAKEFKELSIKVQKLEIEASQLRASQSDAQVMQESMNRLLEYKNMLISRLAQELANHGIVVHGAHIDSIEAQKSKNSSPLQIATERPESKKVKKGIVDTIMDIFKL